MKFRRSRTREPLFWTRNLFDIVVSMDAVASNGIVMADSLVQNVDQLAVGGVTFSGIDERFTARRVLYPHLVVLTASSNGGDVGVMFWEAIVKTSSTALTALIGQKLIDVLAGGAPAIPAAMDLLDFRMQSWVTAAGGHGFVTGTQVNRPEDYDTVARRLEADECIALLTGAALVVGETFAAGASATFRVQYEVSALYSRTLRKR